MKKLTLVLLITLVQQNQLTAMQSLIDSQAALSTQKLTLLDDITVTFDIPPILLPLIAHAAQQFRQDVLKISLLLGISENFTSFGAHTILPENASSQIDVRFIHHPIHLIIFDKNQFDQASFPFKKAAVLHEFFHAIHHDTNPDPLALQHKELATDIQTILNLNCYDCACNYVESRPDNLYSPYLNKNLATVFLKDLDRTQQCDYHKELSKFCHRKAKINTKTLHFIKRILEQLIIEGKLRV